MNRFRTIKANDPKFQLDFVMGFYDHPLTGLAFYDGKRVYFERQYRGKIIELYTLSFYESIKYSIKKKGFELCVGTHQSFEKGKNKEFFYWRSPKWIHVVLYNYYYYGLNFNKWRKK